MKLLKLIIAFFRLDLNVVCEMSKGRGHFDFHDYRDSDLGAPWHFIPPQCVRCGKTFHI